MAESLASSKLSVLSTQAYKVDSEELETALSESPTVGYAGQILIVAYDDVSYIKITDGINTFADLPTFSSSAGSAPVPVAPTTGTFTLKSVDGEIDWVEDAE